MAVVATFSCCFVSSLPFQSGFLLSLTSFCIREIQKNAAFATGSFVGWCLPGAGKGCICPLYGKLLLLFSDFKLWLMPFS